jgi:hypothetical protein
MLIRNGPYTTEINEERNKQMREVDQEYIRVNTLLLTENDENKRNALIRDRDARIAYMKGLHMMDIRKIERRQQREIQETGIEPEADSRRIREQENQQRRKAQQQDMLNRVNARRNDIQEQQAILAAIVMNNLAINNQANVQQNQPQNQNLRDFVKDKQNVHTAVAVKQTKDIVDKILKIPVPEEYRWNTSYCSKTPGEIITDCKLTPKAAWQMQAKYSQEENIYEMGVGIYGKVLDGVWQYIKSSKDKADVISALRVELEDSVGMCAQGNLSRICNILAGFMDGVGSQESLAEILGRELPRLIQIIDPRTRMKEAINLMSNNNVPKDERMIWIEPLFEDVEDEEQRASIFELIH